MRVNSYELKEVKMQETLKTFKSPDGYRSVYKSVPLEFYELLKQQIDFTKYYVMFRGPRPRGASSTRKRHAIKFDIYQRDTLSVSYNRIEREAFMRGVKFASRIKFASRKMYE
jgi:hypothetical protein